MIVSQMSAQGRYIYADPVTIEPDGEAEIVVKLDVESREPLHFLEFRFKLPNGIEPTNPDDPVKSCTLSEELFGEIDSDNVFYVNNNGDGNLYFLISLDIISQSLKDSHGELFRMKVKSKLSEPLTFTPEDIIIDNIYDIFGELIVWNNKLQNYVRDHRNYLYIEDTEVLMNNDCILSVKMRNEIDIEGFSFEIVLPTGMTVVLDDEGNPMASLSEERTTAARTNTFSAVMCNNPFNEVVRVIAASSNGSAISPGDGEVCKVRVRLGTGMKPGKYDLWMSTSSLADTEARSHDRKDFWFTVNFLPLEVGDANGDKTVTVADLTAIAHHVLGNTPNSFSPKAADANQDGQINVADYTAVAHLLLYGSVEAPATARIVRNDITTTDVSTLDNTVYIAPVSAMAGEVAELSVRMKNNVEAEGFQFSLTLPEGVTVVLDGEGFPDVQLSEERTTEKGTNTFASSLTADGTLKVMGASTNGSTISAGDGEVCKVKVRISGNMAVGSYPLLLSDVAISDTNAKSHDVAQVEATLTVNEASGIEHLIGNGKSSNSRLFDLQGRRLTDKPQKGVYIQDGQKYVK